MKQWTKKKKLTTNNMYNKPITQRVAFARGKKASALKQTSIDDTTVLKDEDIMAKLKRTETIPGQETTEIIGGGKGTTEGLPSSTETFVNPKVKGQTWNEFVDAPCGSPGKPYGKGMCKDVEPPKEITTKGPDQTIKEEAPLYGYDAGDVDYTWQQRSRGRQALEGSRKAGKLGRKGYEGMSDADRALSLGFKLEDGSADIASYKEEGIVNKKQFGKAKKAYEAAQASKSYDAYLQGQREASEQGISQGSKGRAKVTVPDRNKYVTQLNKADTETQSTAAQTQAFYQNRKNENDANTVNAAISATNNQDAVDKRNAQENTQTTDVISITAKPTENEDAALKMRNFGPLKMRSSFKMGGYGNKTYKK
jgi:hypothetical protein